MTTRVSLLIVARPDRWLEALRVLLASLPHLHVIGQADSMAAALQMVHDRAPGLVLLDAGLPEVEVQALVRQVKAQRPATRCIVLADTTQRQQVARAAGADAVLLKGMPTASLLAAIV